MRKSLEKGWRYFLLTPFLLLASATTLFLHHGISLFSQEYVTSVFIILALCIPFGILMVFGNLIIRIMIASILVLFFILSLIDQAFLDEIIVELRYRYVLMALLLMISVGLYFIRQNMDKILFILFGVFLVGSFFTPESLFKEKRFDVSGKSNDISLPPYIHIILDEHIGIEGVPPKEDAAHKFSNSIKDKYVKNGFQIYGRAYSRYTESKNSFTSFLMLKAIDNPDKFYNTSNDVINLKENKFFEELSRNGYHINVLQSTFMNLCDKNENISIKRCITYKYDILGKDDSLLSVFFFSALKTMRLIKFYGPFQQSSLGKVLSLPTPLLIPASKAAYNAFPTALELLKNAEMGNAYFVHLLIPHSPYLFNKNCSLISARSRTELGSNYQYYLGQVACVQSLMDQLFSKLDENTNAKNSTIVIHGDHGSRIVLPRTGSTSGGIYPTDENFIQSFSTFFAVRGPEHKAGYDRSPLALDQLLNEVVLGKEHDVDNNGIVYLKKPNGATTGLIRTPLPPFSHGLPAEKW